MKNSLSILLLTILIFFGIVVSFILYKDVEERTINNQYKQNESYANQTARSIEIFFENFKQSLDFISKKEEIIDFNESSKTFIKNYYEARMEVLKAVTRVSADGKILYTYPFVENAIGKDVSTQSHNAEIMKNHKPRISDVMTTVQGYKAIVYAYPVFKDSVYNGAISLVIPFNYIANKFLENISVGRTGSIILASEEGYELYCENDDHIGQNIKVLTKGFEKLESMTSKMLNKESGRSEFVFYDSDSESLVEKIGYFRAINIENTFWSLAVIMNRDEILEANRGLAIKLSLLLILMFFVILIFLLFISKQRKRSREILRKKGLKYQADLEKLVNIRTEELRELNISLREDIGERKKIEKELKIAIERVEKSEKIKSEFLAQMSHEIRTPINTILSFSSLIKEELSEHISQDLQEGFKGIHSAGKRLIRTIDLILNMSDIQLGTVDYIPKRVDIYDDIFKQLETEYRIQVKEKKLNYTTNINTSDTKVVVDTYSVNQIFANLIDNAIKYTDQGKIEIDINRNENGELVVSVSDSGVGISKEYLPRLFDEFTQEDRGYTRKFEGNGLGLALVKKYCELNNASISVKTEKGQGSVFTVVFQNHIN